MMSALKYTPMDAARLRGRGGAVALLSGAAGVAVLLIFLHRYLFPEPHPEFPGPGFKGRKVFISQGRIPVSDFLQFVSDYTGIPVIGGDAFSENEIRIANDIPDADGEVVKAILEVNRIRVFRELTPGGKEVLRVEQMARPRSKRQGH